MQVHFPTFVVLAGLMRSILEFKQLDLTSDLVRWVIPCGTRDGNPEAAHVRLYAHNHVSASLATPTSGSIAPVGAVAVDSH